MAMFNSFPSPPSGPPPAPSAPDLNVEKKKPENVKEYMRWVRNDFQREWLQLLGHPPSAAEQAAFDARPKVAAVDSVIGSGDPAVQMDTIQGDPTTALLNEDLAGFNFFTAGKGENARTRKTLLDDATAHARTMFTSTDPVSGAIIEDTAAIQAARKLFETGEYYRDEKPIRETVWRAMNPMESASATMPEDFEIPATMKPHAEALVHTQQDALRSRSVSIVMGDQHDEEATEKMWFQKRRSKKGYSTDQRERLLHDLEGIIPDNEYQTLRIATGDTSGFSADPTARAIQKQIHQNNLNTLRQKCAEMDDRHDPYQNAQKGFYADLAKTTYDRYVETAIPDPANRTPENLAILKKEVGVRMLTTMMRRDQSMEDAKRAQMRPYETQTERSRTKKVWDWYRGQSIPVRIGVSMAVAAGVGAGMLFVPAFSIPLYFTSLTFGGANYAGASALSVMGARAGRAALSGVIAPQIQRFMVAPIGAGIRRSKERSIQTVQIDDARNKTALNQLATGQNYIDLITVLQDTAREANEKLAHLDKSHKRWSVVAGLGTGLVVGWLAVPKIADAAEAGIAGGGKSNWDYMQRSKDTPWPAGLEGKPDPSQPSQTPAVPADSWDYGTKIPYDYGLEQPPGPPPNLGDTSGATSPDGAETPPPASTPPPTSKEAPTSASPTAKGTASIMSDPYVAPFWTQLYNDPWGTLKKFYVGNTQESIQPPTSSARPAATQPVESTPTGGGKAAGATRAAEQAVAGGTGKSFEVALGARGAQGSVIDELVKQMPKPQAQKLADQMWRGYVADIKANPNGHSALFEKLQKAGYPKSRIDEALAQQIKPEDIRLGKVHPSQIKLRTLLDQAATRMPKGIKVHLEYDPANPANAKMSFVDDQYLPARPARPAVAHQPAAQPPQPPVAPAPSFPQPKVGYLAPEIPPVAQGPAVPTIEYKPVGGAFAQEYQEIADRKVGEFVSETNRLLQEQNAGRPIPSQILPHAYEAGQLDRYARIEEQVAAHAKKFGIKPEQMKDMRMGQLFVPKGGARTIDVALNQPASTPPVPSPGNPSTTIEDSTSNVDTPGT